MMKILMSNILRLSLLFLLTFGITGTINAQINTTIEKSNENLESSERGKLFEWGNYAMFIHWGLYSNLADKWDGKTYYGISEWLMNESMANIDKDEYKAASKSFNPKDFDAKKIAQLAKDAGMKYIIITSKHHDGFAMFHSKVDKFNIVDATPFGRDPMKELAQACKELGLGFGFYYSQYQDWTTPGGFKAPRVDSEGNPRTFDDYFKSKCLPQVEEITSNYGDIEVIWFDTPGQIEKKYVDDLIEVVHRNQPNALISSRIGHNLGDFRTLADMEVPLKNIDGLWESIDVTNDSWGFAWYDNNWKTPKQILQTLISTIARGGTFMMNVGPDGLGNVPEQAAASLRSSGKWVARYPDVIYGAQASPWKHKLPWGDVTRQGNKLYLAVYEWPKDGKLYVPGINSFVKQAKLLDDKTGKRIKQTLNGNWLILDVPYQQPDPMISVIELEMKNNDIDVDTTQALDPEIGLPDLSVLFADTENCSTNKTTWREKFGEYKHTYIVSNLNKVGKITWTVEVLEPITCQVGLNVRGNGRSVWELKSDEGKYIQNQQRATSKFSEVPLGWLKFDKPGKHTITLTMEKGQNPADISSISLIPVKF